MKRLILIFALLYSAVAFAADTCPAAVIAKGITSCYYISAAGSDAAAGTKAAPWLHAPLMPAATGVAAAHTPAGGEGFIFKGGDTWHYGNSGASPYTGGLWAPGTVVAGTHASCYDDTHQSGCIYWGVDASWYTGGSWTRPIFNGDNPLSTSLVANCTYQVASSNASYVNTMVVMGYAMILDNIEFTGLCSQTVAGARDNQDDYYLAASLTGGAMLFETNLYIHGWTAKTTAGSGDNNIPIRALGASANGLQTIDHVVVDGEDSLASIALWSKSVSPYHLRYSIFRYNADGVANLCHDIHDNIFEFFADPLYPTHGNILECNTEASGSYIDQPALQAHVVYNNIIRHATTAFSTSGNVILWLCPNDTPEYWFNNLIYDVGSQNFWDVAGPPAYTVASPFGCTNAGGQYMFNNTLVDGVQPAHLSGGNASGGQYLHVFNQHLINTPLDTLPDYITTHAYTTSVSIIPLTNNAGGYGYAPVANCTSGGSNPTWNQTLGSTTTDSGGCQWKNVSQGAEGLAPTVDASNVQQSDATAVTQGFTGPGRINTQNSSTNCANEGTTPCGPINNTVATIASGINQKVAYCDVLATYTNDSTIGTTAALACMKGTTDGCTYQKSDHTMQCPAQVAVARPTVAAWDSGAYFLNSGVTAPTCTLTASPAVIKLGTSSTLTFTPANTPTGCSIDNGVGAVSCSGATPSVSPTTLTTYTATATNAGGTNPCSASVTIGGCKLNPGTLMSGGGCQ